ncbi:hypothetical protein GCM10007423_02030 [Dyadobacter endophyticus]|uniref:YgiT-type zinc finger domain-containing protein n=1 Tax=Dyadobacter endophyticus TaxID=1749036 RepID=A0ABQ1YDE6_9BACT|nr:hypothetical protein GCM10007423_02030 [Dyadobacter endophyticus]
MALIDLDKIIVKRTILGIRCTVCGGNLLVSEKESAISKLARIISLGIVRPKDYACETCKKRYILL